MRIPAPATYAAINTMVTVARYAASLIGTELVEFDPDGNPVARPLEAEESAVVVPHNAQTSTILAVLSDELHVYGITVDTADSLQGAQWHAVVALDPFVGYSRASPHQLSPRRLCVMASRHMTHLTWIHDGAWEDALEIAAYEDKDAELGLKVRKALTAV
ncbi:hypothetical protein ACX80N_12325 [Arthrobacter sp. MDT2-16]